MDTSTTSGSGISSWLTDLSSAYGAYKAASATPAPAPVYRAPPSSGMSVTQMALGVVAIVVVAVVVKKVLL